MLNEFREFIKRGNVIDLAVGLVIGAAFGKIVTSFVDDILMPPIGMLFGGVDFASLFIPLDGKEYVSIEAAKAAGAATINYGMFINTVIAFLIIAFCVFLIIRQVNKMMPPKPMVAPPPTKQCPRCLSTIPAAATRCPQCTVDL